MANNKIIKTVIETTQEQQANDKQTTQERQTNDKGTTNKRQTNDKVSFEVCNNRNTEFYVIKRKDENGNEEYLGRENAPFFEEELGKKYGGGHYHVFARKGGKNLTHFKVIISKDLFPAKNNNLPSTDGNYYSYVDQKMNQLESKVNGSIESIKTSITDALNMFAQNMKVYTDTKVEPFRFKEVTECMKDLHAMSGLSAVEKSNPYDDYMKLDEIKEKAYLQAKLENEKQFNTMLEMMRDNQNQQLELMKMQLQANQNNNNNGLSGLISSLTPIIAPLVKEFITPAKVNNLSGVGTVNNPVNKNIVPIGANGNTKVTA